MEDNVNAVKFDDLVIAKKNGKLAIFNKENSTFLTEHIYDVILLSSSGYHTVFNAKDVIDEDGKVIPHGGEITYSAIVDNYGKVTEYPGFVFTYICTFNKFGVSQAFSKLTKKYYLINLEGAVLSSGYDRILKINKDRDFGLYIAHEFKNPQTGKFKKTLINHKGEVIPVTFVDDDCNFIYELYDLNNFEGFIAKCGVNIIELTPFQMFYFAKTYSTIFNAVNSSLLLDKNSFEKLLYTLKFLENLSNLVEGEIMVVDPVEPETILPKNFATKSEIEKRHIEKLIKMIYRRVNLIKK